MSAQAKQTSRGRKAKTTDVNLELRTQYRRATKAMIATGKAKEGDLVPVETLHFDGGTQQNVKTTINALDVAINGLNDKQLSNVSPKLREQYKGLIVEMGAHLVGAFADE